MIVEEITFEEFQAALDAENERTLLELFFFIME